MKPAAVLIALLLAAGPSAAAEPAKKPDAQAARIAQRKAQAIQLLHRANAAMRARRYQRAFDLLRERLTKVSNAEPDDHYNLIQLAKARKSCPDVLLHVQIYLAQSAEDPEEKDLRRQMKRCMPPSKKRATLTVTAKPKEAHLWLDGVPIGALVGKPITLRAGKHRIRAEATDFIDGSEEVGLEGRAEKSLEVVLEKMTFYGTLEVKTEPPGATVIVDGKELGVTPLAPATLTEGKHNIKLSKEGYDLFVRNVSLGRNEAYLFETKLFRPGESVEDE